MVNAQEFADEYNESLNAIKRRTKIPIKDLLAMSSSTDPFWMTKSKVEKALWAKDVVDTIVKPHINRIGVKNIHLRDIHYILVSIPHHLPDGETYENTMKAWKELIQAFSVARYLDFVDYSLIRDNKNEFYKRTYYGRGRTFNTARYKAKENIAPETIIEKILLKPFERLLNPWSTQKFHIEIWAEKDLALLDKVSEDWGINLVVGEGETSVTMVYELADRIRVADKPTRICYVADCDVVGMNMSKAMARKVEYLLNRRGSELDVKLVPIMLTAPQVREFDLPTVPMKTVTSTVGVKHGYETRKENWYAAQELDGAVEVNAMHAQHPDEFKDTIEGFIRNYLDVDKWNEFVEYRKGVKQMVRDKMDDSLLDLSSFTDMYEAVDWADLRKTFNDDIKDIGISDISIDEADLEYSWLLDTTLTYGGQMNKYNLYEDGNL
jgi:hypothetical protein